MLKDNLIILIPPSEAKCIGGNLKPLETLSGSLKHVLELYGGYNGDLTKLYGLKEKALRSALNVNREILNSPTMPVINRYTGVVYKGIDYDSLEDDSKKYFDQHIRIVSAAFGLIDPKANIPNYKIKIDKCGLDKYWRPINEKVLRDKFCVDLLPQPQKKAVTISRGIRIEFLFKRNGKYISAGHQGKFIKGQFIRWAATEQLPMDEFLNFNTLKAKFLKEIQCRELLIEIKNVK